MNTTLEPVAAVSAVEAEVLDGLASRPRTLSPWLFYDAAGSALFECITQLPEYYLTRTERSIFTTHATEMISQAAGSDQLTILELGAGTATKTGLLLQAATAHQGHVVYRPIDISQTALNEAQRHLELNIPGVTVVPQAADYTRGLDLGPTAERRLVLYIGSSIGNFSPAQALSLLTSLRGQLSHGDALLLGVDMAPGSTKTEACLLAAYDDATGVTAELNLNVLRRLNRELRADFDVTAFRHRVLWNQAESRIEMHLQSTRKQLVTIPQIGLELDFNQGETIHTENSYKFTDAMIAELLYNAGFGRQRTWTDPRGWFTVQLAVAE